MASAEVSGFGSVASWTGDRQRARAFRDLVSALAPSESYTAAIEAAAAPIAIGVRSAVMIGLLDASRDTVHALGVYDPSIERAGVIDQLFQAPFIRRGRVAKVLEDDVSDRGEVDHEYMRATWPEYAEVAEQFRLAQIALVPYRTLGGVRGVIWAGRTESEPPFSDDDMAFLADCGTALATAVHAGFLQEALQRAAGRRAPQMEPTGPPGGAERRRDTLLSERERDVLRLLAAGYTNRETADELRLSIRTVEWHRARIQWKLGVSGRADLTRAAREQGVLS